jgi:hypothetical protein
MIIKNIDGTEIDTNTMTDEESHLLELIENLRNYCVSINRTVYVSIDRKPSSQEREKMNKSGIQNNEMNHSFWNIRYSPEVFNEIKDIKNYEYSTEIMEKVMKDKTGQESKLKLFGSMHWFINSFSFGFFGVYPAYAVDMDKLNNPPGNSIDEK